jgi:hypothetical protein
VTAETRFKAKSDLHARMVVSYPGGEVSPGGATLGTMQIRSP